MLSNIDSSDIPPEMAAELAPEDLKRMCDGYNTIIAAKRARKDSAQAQHPTPVSTA